jgi:predicted HTH transcriptional regulator
MKEPQFWQEEDLFDLIRNKHEENIELDYKRADALQSSDGKKAEISKDVSAFANSIGGTVLYGMEEHPNAPHHATAVSPVDPSAHSKEWLEQVMNSRIQPRIPGIVINSIELKEAAPGKFAYAVVVPESTTAHQASDKRYYKRFNFLSVPMEDDEVRLAMNRASRPAYTVRLEREGSGSTNLGGGIT